MMTNNNNSSSHAAYTTLEIPAFNSTLLYTKIKQQERRLENLKNRSHEHFKSNFGILKRASEFYFKK